MAFTGDSWGRLQFKTLLNSIGGIFLYTLVTDFEYRSYDMLYTLFKMYILVPFISILDLYKLIFVLI